MDVLSHETAGLAWGLPVLQPRPGPHVLLDPGSTSYRAGIVVHRGVLVDGDVQLHDGVPVTSPTRTVLDLARCLPLGEAVAVADAALRLGLTSRAALLDRAELFVGPGSAAARRTAFLSTHRAASPFESLARIALVEARLEPISVQFCLFEDGHPYDLALPSAGVLIECDGREFHQSEDAFGDDVRHGNASVGTRVAAGPLHGWALVRLLWGHVWPDSALAVRLVRAAVLTGEGPRVRKRRSRAKQKAIADQDRLDRRLESRGRDLRRG